MGDSIGDRPEDGVEETEACGGESMHMSGEGGGLR